MLNFDKKGYLTPSKAISSNINELEQIFVVEYSSIERSRLFAEYLHYTKDLKEVCGDICIQQWINGSFITRNTPRPNDIDLITFINTDIWSKIEDKLIPFIYPNSKINYPGVDAYLVESFEENDDKHLLFESDKAYWHHLFDTSRRNRNGNKMPKGFLEIIY